MTAAVDCLNSQVTHLAMLALILMLLHGCSSTTEPFTPSGSPTFTSETVEESSQIPSMDDLELIQSRIAADVTGEYDNEMLSANADINQGALRLESPANGMAWALWGWYGLSAADYPVSVTVTLREGEDEYWIAIWDFVSGCWTHAGPYVEPVTVITPPDLTKRAISAGGTFYVVVLTHDGNERHFESLSVTTGSGEPLPDRPRWLTATDGAFPDQIEVDWHESVDASSFRLIRWQHGIDESNAVELNAALDAPPYMDSTVSIEQLYYYRVFAANATGGTRGSTLDIDHAGSFESAWQVSGTAIRHRIVPPYPLPFGCELKIADYNYMCGTGPEGTYVFPGIQEGTYQVWLVTSNSQVSIGHATVDDSDAVGPNYTGSLHTAPDYEWYWLFPVSGLELTETGFNDATLFWSPTQWATEYRVYRAASGDQTEGVLLDTVAEASCELLDQPEGEYYYWVQAVDSSIEPQRETMWSGPVSFLSLQPPEPGKLYAIPSTTTASVGETVTVLIYSGEFPLDAQFNFLDGAGLTVNEGADYVDLSYNVGAVGGNADESDGIWETMNPIPVGYIMPQDWMMSWKALHDNPTMGRIDLHVCAIGGSNVTNGGCLLNLGLEFESPGTYTLGFQFFEDVERTRYSDATSVIHYWDDISNDHAANTIVVE